MWIWVYPCESVMKIMFNFGMLLELGVLKYDALGFVNLGVSY